jgi:hypothetical protein
MPGDDPFASVYFDSSGLSVRVAAPRYLFVMKAMAARESDIDDLRLLYRLSNFSSAAEAIDSVVNAYPSRIIKPNVTYLVEEIAAEASQEPPTIPFT